VRKHGDIYLERLKHIWEKVFIRYPNTRLKIIADKFFHCEKMPIIMKKWNYNDELNDLHTFDIGLMPLTDDIWSKGKCGFKLLQYMAAGIPVICSPVGVNKEIVTHEVNGFLVENENGWLDSIGKLVKDYRLRETMGKQAFKTVNDCYSLGIWAPRLIKILKNNISQCR
jgi:glycosyltransferase involved in cell wall biosynthesis